MSSASNNGHTAGDTKEPLMDVIVNEKDSNLIDRFVILLFPVLRLSISINLL